MTDEQVVPIKKPKGDLATAVRVTKLAQRLGVRPNPKFTIGFMGQFGEQYCMIDLMTAFMSKIDAMVEALEETKE